VNDPACAKVKQELRARIIEHMESTSDRVGGKLLHLLKLDA